MVLQLNNGFVKSCFIYDFANTSCLKFCLLNFVYDFIAFVFFINNAGGSCHYASTPLAT